MQINDGEMYVTKSRNYENSYYTKELKKDKDTGEYITDYDNKKISTIKTVYLPDGTVLDDFSHIRFKGYTSFSVNDSGSIREYIVVTDLLEVLDSNNSNNNFMSNSDDDLPF